MLYNPKTLEITCDSHRVLLFCYFSCLLARKLTAPAQPRLPLHSCFLKVKSLF